MATRSERLPLPRRAFLGGAACLALGARHHPAGAEPGPPALAQGTTALQRVILEQVAYRDVPAYVAFVDAVAGPATTARAAFQTRLNELRAAPSAALALALGSALEKGVVFDCSMLVANRPNVPLAALTDALVARSGFSLALGKDLPLPDGVANGIARGAALAGSVQRLLGTARLGDFGPVLASSVAGTIAGLPATPEGGLLGLLSLSSSALRNLSKNGGSVAQIAALTADIDTFTRSAKDFASSISQGHMPDPSVLKGAVTALGRALRLPPETINKINKVVDIAGSVVSGAIAGSAFGPIGTVVGGAVGLLCSLFGGGEPERDPNFEALKVIDQKLDALRDEMRGQFDSLRSQLVTITQAMLDGFQRIAEQLQAIQQAIVELRLRVEQQYTQIMAAISSLQQGVVQSSFAELNVNILIADDAYRTALLAGAAPATFPDVTRAYALAKVHLASAGTGFSNPARLGMLTLADLIAETAKAQASEQLMQVMQYESALTGLPPAPRAQASPRVLAGWILAALRDTEHVAGPTQVTTERRWGTVVADAQSTCVSYLDGFAGSPEWTRLSSEETELQAGTRQGQQWRPLRGVPAILPADLAWVSAQLAEALGRSTRADLTTQVLADAVPMLRERLAMQSLFTDPVARHALLFARRKIAAAFVKDAALLMSNPLMRGAMVLRRAIRTALSTGSQYLNRHSRDRIASEAEAQARVAAASEREAPLANVARQTFSSNWPELGQLRIAVSTFFTLPVPATRGAGIFPYLNDTVNMLGQQFAVAYLREWPETRLDDRLHKLVRLGLVLRLVDEIIDIRLKMVSANNPGTTVGWRQFAAPLDEYTRLFMRALAEPLPQQQGPNPVNVQPEPVRGTVLLRALLEPPITNVGIPGAFTGAPETALPYPKEIGHFWGWGAEGLDFDQPDAPALGEALAQPDCFLAVTNQSTLAAASNYMLLASSQQQLRLGANVVQQLRAGPLQQGLAQALLAALP